MARTFEWARHEIFFHFKKGVSCVLYANKVKDFEWNQRLFQFYFLADLNKKKTKKTFWSLP